MKKVKKVFLTLILLPFRMEKLTQGEAGFNCVPKEEAVDLGQSVGL